MFTHMLNLTMANAWNIYRTATAEPMDFLSFVLNVTRFSISLSQKGNNQSYGRTPKPGNVPDSVVSDTERHFLMKLKKENNNAVLSAMLEFVGAARIFSKIFACNVTALRGSIQGKSCCKLCASAFISSKIKLYKHVL